VLAERYQNCAVGPPRLPPSFTSPIRNPDESGIAEGDESSRNEQLCIPEMNCGANGGSSPHPPHGAIPDPPSPGRALQEALQKRVAQKIQEKLMKTRPDITVAELDWLMSSSTEPPSVRAMKLHYTTLGLHPFDP